MPTSDRVIVRALAATLVMLLVSEARAQEAQVEPAPQPTAVPAPSPTTTVDLAEVLRGEGRGWTSEAVAQRALETAPSLDRARAAVRQAGAGADRALYGLIPQVNVGFRYTRLSEIQNQGLVSGDAPMLTPDIIEGLIAGVEDPAAREVDRRVLTMLAGFSSFRVPVILDQYSLTAGLTYPLSDAFLSLLPAYEAAQENVRAAEHNVDAQREEIAYSARQAYYNFARARGGLAVAQISLEQAEARHEQVQAFVAAGTVAAVDELRIRAQVAASRVAVLRAAAGVRLASTALRTLLHLPGNAEVAIAEDVLAPLPSLDANLDALVQRALAQREDVLTLRSLIRAAERQVVAAEGSRWPHLAISANFDYSNPQARVFPQTQAFRESWDVSAIVSWSPHDVLYGEAQADEARAVRDQTAADLRSLQDAIRVEVVDAATSYEASREALEASRVGVEAAEESYRVQLERYRAGVATLTDLTDAAAEQANAQLELVNAATTARIARAALARALGTGASRE